MGMATRGKLRGWSCLALASGALALPTAAHAAFPGENGRIAFPYVQLRPPPPTLTPDPYKPGWESPVVVSSRIETVLPSGQARRALHTFPAEAPNYTEEALTYEAAWSPDGRVVAFEEGPPSATRLTIMRHDGTGLRRLPRLTDSDGSPAWSPTGRRLAFEGVRPCPHYCNWLYTVRTDGTGLRRVIAIGALWPAWSVTGRIAFVNEDDQYGTPSPDDGLITIRPDGARTRRLFGRYWGTGASPDWSPDGRRLAFSARSGHIYTIRANGRGLRRLTELDWSGNTDPAWSPDGRYIAFTHTDSADRADNGIYVMRSNGSGRRQIVPARYTESSDGALTQWEVLGAPSWQPR